MQQAQWAGFVFPEVFFDFILLPIIQQNNEIKVHCYIISPPTPPHPQSEEHPKYLHLFLFKEDFLIKALHTLVIVLIIYSVAFFSFHWRLRKPKMNSLF